MTSFAKPLGLLAVLAVTGCASSGAPAVPETGTVASPAPATPAAAPTVAPDPAVLTVSRGQSNRGRDGFMSSCTACHGSSEFSDASFKRRWRNRTAGDLFDFVSGAMPEDDPGSLPTEVYVDIVTYFLGMNGFSLASSGAEIDEAGLESISLAPFARN